MLSQNIIGVVGGVKNNMVTIDILYKDPTIVA
jgi:hypothetical protein